MGGSSYIDSVILRDKDANTAWTAASDATLEERRYLVQNWRADVTTMDNTSGEPVEWYRYTAYGQPTSHPIADVNGDGSVTSADTAAWLDLQSGDSSGSVWLTDDLNRDDVFPGDTADDTFFYAQQSAASGLSIGYDRQSAYGLRKGYAGYEWDDTLTMWHVRHRVLDSKSGKWTKNDPIGYRGGRNLTGYVETQPIRRTDSSGLKGCVTGLCVGLNDQAPADWPSDIPFPPNFTPGEGTPADQCRRAKDGMCRYDSVYGPMVRHLEKRLAEVCGGNSNDDVTPSGPAFPVVCDDSCDGGDGRTSPAGPIVICTRYTPLIGRMNACQIYAHELVHQIQFCLLRKLGIEPRDVSGDYKLCIVMESQAYVIDGSCNDQPDTNSFMKCICQRACGSCRDRTPRGADCVSDCLKLWYRPGEAPTGGIRTRIEYPKSGGGIAVD